MLKYFWIFATVFVVFGKHNVTVLAPHSDSVLISEVTSALTEQYVEKYQFSVVFKDIDKAGVFITIAGRSYSVDNFSISTVDSLLSEVLEKKSRESGGSSALLILLAFMIFLPYLVFKFRKSTQKLLSER